jgi:hypothetical protein
MNRENCCLDQDHATQHLNLKCLVLLLLLNFQQQSAVDMGKDTSKGDGGADKGVEFFVSTNGELKVAGGDTLDFKILCGILGMLV